MSIEWRRRGVDEYQVYIKIFDGFLDGSDVEICTVPRGIFDAD